MKICCNGNTAGLKKVNSKIEGIGNFGNFGNVDLEGRKVLLFYPGTEMKVENLNEGIREFSHSFEFFNIGVKQLRLEEHMFISLNKLREFYL